MVSAACDPAAANTGGPHLPPGVDRAVKIVIAGNLGVGKTTFVGALSEITPLRTEETMTEAGAHVDDLAGVRTKATTTVAMDFGRLTLNRSLVLYLFGTPGQPRFAGMWHDLARGALGALVLVDTRRLDESFPVLDRVEELGLRHAVAINRFDDAPAADIEDVCDALELDPGTPLVTCDARDRGSSGKALITLTRHLLARAH